MPSVCVCVGGGGGGGYSYLYIFLHENRKKLLKLKDFEPPKMVWAYYVWKYQSSLPPHPGKYVSTRGNGLSKCFIYLG